MDNPDYIRLGEIAIGILGQQCQYVSRYLCPLWQQERLKEYGYPYLGEGLRIIGDSSDYNSMYLHKDDVDIFVKRYQESGK